MKGSNICEHAGQDPLRGAEGELRAEKKEGAKEGVPDGATEIVDSDPGLDTAIAASSAENAAAANSLKKEKFSGGAEEGAESKEKIISKETIYPAKGENFVFKDKHAITKEYFVEGGQAFASKEDAEAGINGAKITQVLKGTRYYDTIQVADCKKLDARRKELESGGKKNRWTSWLSRG